jgi:hypothetical protein
MIPYNFFPRTKTGSLVPAAVDVIPTKILTEEEKAAVRRAVLGGLEEDKLVRPLPVWDSQKILDTIGGGGRTGNDFTPDELAEIEAVKARKKAEQDAPASLDNIDLPPATSQK